MLESMIGADTFDKMKVQLIGAGFVVASFIGTLLISLGSSSPLYPAHFFPGVGIVCAAGLWFMVKHKFVRYVLAFAVMGMGLWVLINVGSGCVIAKPPTFTLVPELMPIIIGMLAGGVGGIDFSQFSPAIGQMIEGDLTIISPIWSLVFSFLAGGGAVVAVLGSFLGLLGAWKTE